jgi:BirA family biotin operon repressor/biotin-[acetyl-CoA-carboxylase] ligase
MTAVPFQTSEFQRGLATTVLGRVVHFQPAVDSTNALARSLAGEGAADGALVVTDFQTAGKGRLDRAWQAPAGTSLLFSLILRPRIAVGRISQVTMAAGLGCVAGIARACGLSARLKWPNDVTLAGRKAGGMLGEFGLRDDALDYVIVGIGLNGNFDPAGMEGIPPGAASLMTAAGHRWRANPCCGPSLRKWSRAT